jgi:hypothetical protein
MLALSEDSLFYFQGHWFIVFECNEIRYAFVLSETDAQCIEKFLAYAQDTYNDGSCRYQTIVKIDCAFEARDDALARHIVTVFQVHPLLIATIDTAFRSEEWLAQNHMKH